MQDAPSFRLVHDNLLERSAAVIRVISSHSARLSHFRRLYAAYLLDADALQVFFHAEVSRTDDESRASKELLQEIYLAWRGRDVAAAALGWAGWLLAEGKGREAADVVQRARAEVEGGSKLRLEEGWRRVCDDSTKRQDKDEESDDAMDQG